MNAAGGMMAPTLSFTASAALVSIGRVPPVAG